MCCGVREGKRKRGREENGTKGEGRKRGRESYKGGRERKGRRKRED